MENLNSRQSDVDSDTDQTPLIRETSSRQAEGAPASATGLLTIPTLNVPKVHNSQTIVNLLCAIIFVASSGGGFSYIPLARLIEDSYCRQYYESGNYDHHGGNIDEQLCKVPSIQSKVAFVFAIAGAIDAVVGFVAALPWGTAADRLGRKLVFALALLGGALSSCWWIFVLWFHPNLPIWSVWFGSVALFLGGGSVVLMAVLLSMVADVASEDTRAVLFMRIHIASLLGNLSSPALSSIMMKMTGPWPVLWVGITCLLVSAVAFSFVPETLQHKTSSDVPGQPTSMKKHLSDFAGSIMESVNMLKSRSLIIMLTTSLLVQPIYFATVQLLIQYVSKRYGLRIEDTGYIQTIYGAAQVFQALVGLPTISRLMTSHLERSTTMKVLRIRNEQQRDLLLARSSLFILVPGLFILGVASSLGLFIFGLLVLAIGAGYSSYTRSLMSLFVESGRHSRLFSLVAMVDVAGSVYSGPMLAGLFSAGMDLGDAWVGLPYFVLAAIVSGAFILLLFVRLPKTDAQASSNGSSETESQDL